MPSALLPLPEWARVAIVQPPLLQAQAALPEELACLSPRAVESRRRDFSLGRLAARQALAELGCPPVPLLVGEGGAPRWPEGVVGAITHAAGWAAAAVAPEAKTAGIGIDVECFDTPEEDIAELVASERERAWMAGDARRLITLFSAKESVYKAFYRHRGEFFGFEAVQLRWSGAGFEAELQEPMGAHWPVGFRFFVHCVEQPDQVWTSLCLPPLP